MGDGKLKNHLIQRINSSELRKKVTVVGNIPYVKMNKEYENADVLVFCSLRESSGTVILEAMKNALPIIALNRFGAALILDNDNSWKITGNSLEELKKSFTEAIVECCEHPMVMRKKGQQAFLDAYSLTWSKKVSFYQQLYESILK